MSKKDIKNPPGKRRPPLNPKGSREDRKPAYVPPDSDDEQTGDILQDNPATAVFLKAFAVLMVIMIGVVIANAYQYYKRPEVTYVVERGDVITSTYGKGHIEPKNIQKIALELPDISVVNAVHADVDNVVRRGDLLIEISDKILISRIFIASQHIDYYKLNYKNAVEFFHRRYATEADLKREKQKLEDAERQLEFYKSFVDNTKIYAERNGIVLERNVDPGDKVEPGQTLMWVGERSPRWVMLDIEEEEARNIRIGDQAMLYFGYVAAPRMEDYEHHGIVSRIVPPLKYKDLPFEKDTYEIYVEPDPEAPQPPSRTPVSAEILHKDVTDVPWVQYRSVYKETYVFVKEPDGTVKARYVELGAKGHRGNRIEVIRGLDVGERVVLFPQEYVARYGRPDLPPAD